MFSILHRNLLRLQRNGCTNVQVNVHVYVTEYVREYVREDWEHVCMLEIGRQGRAAYG